MSFKFEKVFSTVIFECHTSSMFYFALGLEKGEREKKFHIFCVLSSYYNVIRYNIKKHPLLQIAITPTNNATRFLLTEVEKFVKNILIL